MIIHHRPNTDNPQTEYTMATTRLEFAAIAAALSYALKIMVATPTRTASDVLMLATYAKIVGEFEEAIYE